MEAFDFPEPAPHDDAGIDALAPNAPPDREDDLPARPFPWSSSIQIPPSRDAIDNARRGTWVMTDYLDGWMLMGANGRPVMRADGSKVAFWLRDIDRLAQEWIPAEGDASPTAKQRARLAELDIGLDSDWDPATGRGYRADVTKSARRLTHYFAQRTEPEEAARRAVAMVLGDPVMVKEGNISAFVPKRFNLAAAKSIANAMWTDLVGREGSPAEISEPSVPLGGVVNENDVSNSEQPRIGDAWLEETISGVVEALNAEDIESARFRVHELADKLKPFAEFTRAIVEQHTAITSGKFDVDKFLGPAKAFFDLIKDPDGAAFIAALGTRYRSQINRSISGKQRREWWMQQARENPQKYKKKDLENMMLGKAEKDANGKSMELHHVDGTPEGGLKKMTRYGHRGGPNYLKNHPFLKNKK